MAHIRRAKSGSYQVRYRDPSGRERAKNFARKVDAQRFAATIEADKARGEWIDPRLGRITFAEWAEQIERSNTSRRETTRARDEASLRNHLVPFFGPMRLSAIQPSHIRDWVAAMERKSLAPATIHKAYQILSRLFSVAATDGRIAQSPCRGVSLPAINAKEPRFLTASEVNLLADAIDPRFRALVLAAAFTGLRFGELAALRVDHLQALRSTVRVEETLTEVSGHLRFGPPKTKASQRTLTMPRFLVEEIVKHLEAFPDPSRLLFTAPEGGPLRRTNFRRRFWLPAVDRSIGRPCTFHDLRHTHAALLIAEGAHPKVIQERMGHSSIKTTLDTYGHLFEGLDEAAAEALDGLFSRTRDAGNPSMGGLSETAAFPSA